MPISRSETITVAALSINISTNMIAIPGPLWLKPRRETSAFVPWLITRIGRLGHAVSTSPRTVSNAAARSSALLERAERVFGHGYRQVGNRYRSAHAADRGVDLLFGQRRRGQIAAALEDHRRLFPGAQLIAKTRLDDDRAEGVGIFQALIGGCAPIGGREVFVQITVFVGGSADRCRSQTIRRPAVHLAAQRQTARDRALPSSSSTSIVIVASSTAPPIATPSSAIMRPGISSPNRKVSRFLTLRSRSYKSNGDNRSHGGPLNIQAAVETPQADR